MTNEWTQLHGIGSSICEQRPSCLDEGGMALQLSLLTAQLADNAGREEIHADGEPPPGGVPKDILLVSRNRYCSELTSAFVRIADVAGYPARSGRD